MARSPARRLLLHERYTLAAYGVSLFKYNYWIDKG